MKRILPFLVLILAIGYLASSLFSRRQTTEFDLEGFGKLPVLVNGRLKPIDTVARTSLLMFQGRQAVKNPAGAPLVSPVAWLLDVLFRPELADHYQHFEIVHPDVLALFNRPRNKGRPKKRFSYAQLSGKLANWTARPSLPRRPRHRCVLHFKRRSWISANT
jgi:hypothetical protein